MHKGTLANKYSNLFLHLLNVRTTNFPPKNKANITYNKATVKNKANIRQFWGVVKIRQTARNTPAGIYPQIVSNLSGI